jgi:hypothetical protein
MSDAHYYQGFEDGKKEAARQAAESPCPKCAENEHLASSYDQERTDALNELEKVKGKLAERSLAEVSADAEEALINLEAASLGLLRNLPDGRYKGLGEFRCTLKEVRKVVEGIFDKRVKGTFSLRASGMTPVTEFKIRAFLWQGHGHDVLSLYGDDGEMSCSQCRTDYKREDLSVVVEVARKASITEGLRRLAEHKRVLAKEFAAARQAAESPGSAPIDVVKKAMTLIEQHTCVESDLLVRSQNHE